MIRATCSSSTRMRQGYKKGSRLIVGEGVKPPTELADRFEVYRPAQLALAVGDRVRVTAGGKTKDGKHRLSNGSLLTVQGFTKRGDIIVDHGWVIDRDFGHLTHGYVVTSHASQGVTVDKVFIGMSSESFPATYQRTAYVAVTRGKEQALIFTDDRKELLKAISRPDDPLSATELSNTEQKPAVQDRLKKHTGVRPWLSASAAQRASCSRAAKETRRYEGGWTMTDDKLTHQERLQRKAHAARHAGQSPTKEAEAEGAGASCGRSVRLSAGTPRPGRRGGVPFPGRQQHLVPLRLAGNLAVQSFRGLLLKFSGDLVYLVLIRGSNLDRPLNEGAINLTHAGLQRHRVLWVREMSDEEIRQVGETGPTIDSIEVAEFESHADLKAWMSHHAPGFLN